MKGIIVISKAWGMPLFSTNSICEFYYSNYYLNLNIQIKFFRCQASKPKLEKKKINLRNNLLEAIFFKGKNQILIAS